MSDLAARATLWFLRRFKAFRAHEEAVSLLQLLTTQQARRLCELRMAASNGLRINNGSVESVERELHIHMLHWLPVWCQVEVLPTIHGQPHLGPGQIQVRMFTGGQR